MGDRCRRLNGEGAWAVSSLISHFFNIVPYIRSKLSFFLLELP